jgi:hypothetical protein
MDGSYEPLRGWIERVAHEDNLCLSVAHIAELAGWKRYDLAARMARWYESLPIVWVRTFHHAAREEMEHALLRAAGISTSATYHPFAERVIEAFDALREDSQNPSEFGSVVARTMRLDDNDPSVSRLSDEQRDEMLAANVLARLHEEVAEVQRSLLARGTPDLVASADAHELVTGSFNNDPRALPCFRLRYGVLAGWRDKATRTSDGKKSAKAFKGTFHDVTHFVRALMATAP